MLYLELIDDGSKSGTSQRDNNSSVTPAKRRAEDPTETTTTPSLSCDDTVIVDAGDEKSFSSPIQHLSDEILLYILNFLSSKDLITKVGL